MSNIVHLPPRPERLEARRKRKRRAFLFAVVVSASGLLCYLLPPHYQQPCHICAKVLQLVAGSH